MGGFKSGLTFDQLKAAADAGALDTLSRGSVRKNGRKWQAQVSYRVSDFAATSEEDLKAGKVKTRRVFLTHTFADTQSQGRNKTKKTGEDGYDAIFTEWRAQVIKDIELVGGMSVDPSQPTRLCIEQFIIRSANRSHRPIRKSTEMNYRYALKRICKYPLADLPLMRVTTAQVQGMLDDLDRENLDGGRKGKPHTGLSRKTIKMTFDLLNLVCKDAFPEPAMNPCAGVSVPDGKPSERRKGGKPNTLSRAAVGKFNHLCDTLDASDEVSDEMKIMSLAVRFALNTGVRCEELCSLRWSDVDFSDSGVRISISHVIERCETPVTDDSGSPLRDEKGNIRTGYREFDTINEYVHEDRRTKSHSSIRSFGLTTEAERIITERYDYVANTISLLFEGEEDSAPEMADLYVFSNDLNGAFTSPRRLGKLWLRFAADNELIGTNGVIVSIHDMRHTFGSFMASSGMDRRHLKVLMGHSDWRTTEQYYIREDDAQIAAEVKASSAMFNARLDSKVTPFRAEDRMTHDGTNG